MASIAESIVPCPVITMLTKSVSVKCAMRSNEMPSISGIFVHGSLLASHHSSSFTQDRPIDACLCRILDVTALGCDAGRIP